ncbi:ABC transporter permease [Paenibacillus sacheonensis]|uniref:ABC transporter permease n=1 Tax=Paenibacillus sacheonensis TaxID=742054 RepID=A0A7X4YRH3_9BACL|nr:ABC-2 family transporter protein [Paenibacillus sacheonensis]MBM7564930.1 ABC-2 type transport system permease protein [Paenibacillus sacheonensis]NBC70281.1 hypothetical protein [Paenibacillus sacheonensis]
MKIYLRLQAANLRARAMYPLNFTLILVSVAFFGMTNIILTWVLTQKVPIIAGWNLYQIVFVMSLWRFSHGFFITFSQQIWNLEYLVREGVMDRFLVRPLNPMFQFFAMRIQIYGFGDLLAGIGGLVYAAPHIGHWNVQKLLLLVVVVLSGAVIEWALMTLLGVSAFWTLQSGGLMGLLDTLLDQFSRFPLSVYGRPVQIVLSFVLPISFMAFYPSYIFMDGMEGPPFSSVLVYASPAVAAGLAWLAYYVWRKGLNAYQGAGS